MIYHYRLKGLAKVIFLHSEQKHGDSSFKIPASQTFIYRPKTSLVQMFTLLYKPLEEQQKSVRPYILRFFVIELFNSL